jgi:hypothetical protein
LTTFVVATLPLTKVSTNASSECEICRISRKSTFPANRRCKVTPHTAVNASALSVNSVSHTPLLPRNRKHQNVSEILKDQQSPFNNTHGAPRAPHPTRARVTPSTRIASPITAVDHRRRARDRASTARERHQHQCHPSRSIGRAHLKFGFTIAVAAARAPPGAPCVCNNASFELASSTMMRDIACVYV